MKRKKTVLLILLTALTCLLLISGISHGSGISPRIIGGIEAEPGAWPFMAALVYSDYESLYDGQMCAGSLIDPEWIVTAAHCVKTHGTQNIDPEAIDVVLGVHDLKQDSGERIEVDRIIAHPEYDAWTWDNDIALMHLKTPSTNKPIEPIRNDSEIAGMMAVILGWGTTSPYGGVYPEKLREARVPVISNQACNESFNRNTVYNDPITEHMLCAGYAEGGVDSCQNDSGGPLIVEMDGVWKIAGIVSWGEGCAKPGFYGVYTRVAAFSEFLETNLEKTNHSPIAEGDIYSVNRGETLRVEAPGILQNDSDPDGDIITAGLSMDTSHGSLELSSDGSFTYTNDGTDVKNDSFSYTLSDGVNLSEPAVVTIRIDAPQTTPAETSGGGGGGFCFIGSLW